MMVLTLPFACPLCDFRSDEELDVRVHVEGNHDEDDHKEEQQLREPVKIDPIQFRLKIEDSEQPANPLSHPQPPIPAKAHQETEDGVNSEEYIFCQRDGCQEPIHIA